MGLLSEQAGDEPITASGSGKRLVEWWDQADADDRALLKQWIDTPTGEPGGKSYREIAERLTATGFPISMHTVAFGARLLRRLPEWDS